MLYLPGKNTFNNNKTAVVGCLSPIPPAWYDPLRCSCFPTSPPASVSDDVTGPGGRRLGLSLIDNTLTSIIGHVISQSVCGTKGRQTYNSQGGLDREISHLWFDTVWSPPYILAAEQIYCFRFSQFHKTTF